jgi:hypothetical protein
LEEPLVSRCSPGYMVRDFGLDAMDNLLLRDECD